jgi:hypothetical protein
VEILKEMKTINGKKALKTFCSINNCVTKRWELKPFYDESEESKRSYIEADIFAYEQIVNTAAWETM